MVGIGAVVPATAALEQVRYACAFTAVSAVVSAGFYVVVDVALAFFCSNCFPSTIEEMDVRKREKREGRGGCRHANGTSKKTTYGRYSGASRRKGTERDANVSIKK